MKVINKTIVPRKPKGMYQLPPNKVEKSATDYVRKPKHPKKQEEVVY